ncbi:unnamed protein product, partial [Symbiodinium necroappetens]
VFAQLAAFVTFAAHLPQSIVAFIDNTAGQAALSKEYGKDPAVRWTRVHGPHAEILRIFDPEFATTAATDDLLMTAQSFRADALWGVGARGGCRMRPAPASRSSLFRRRTA